METRPFGNTGLQTSVLGFGAAPIGVLETPQEQVTQLLNELLDLGVNTIDTAAGYRGSEEAIGKAIAHRRDEFVLISKCGQAFEGLAGDAWSAQVIEQTIDRALTRLQTDRIDVMLLHTCDLETLQRGEALEALVQARQAGKVRFSGYSGDNDAIRYAIAHDQVSAIETSINVCDQVNIHDALPLAADEGVGVIAKRPIANAAWKQLGDQPGFYSEYAKTYTERLAEMNVSLNDLGIPGSAETAWPELALRFTLTHQPVHTAIIGTTNVDHLRHNIQSVAKGPLSDDVMEALYTAFRSAQAEEGWPGLT